MTEASWILGTLGPGTYGCLDIEGDHLCEASPGPVEASGSMWNVSDVVRLHPLPEGVSPRCHSYKVAAVADFVDDADAERLHWRDVYPKTKGTPLPLPSTVEEPRAHFQWKGTDVELAFTCLCGRDLELDGAGFAYFIGCPCCPRIYQLEPYVSISQATRST